MFCPPSVQRAVTSRRERGSLDLQLKRLGACLELQSCLSSNILCLGFDAVPRGFSLTLHNLMVHFPLATNSTSWQDLCQILIHERSVCGINLFLQSLLTITPKMPTSSSYRKCNHFWLFTVDTLQKQRKRKLCMEYSMACERLLIYSALYQGLEQGRTSRRTPDHRVRTTS